MIWLFVGATVAAVWLFLVILYVSGDLKRILCGHHHTQELYNGGTGEVYVWECLDCGKVRQ